MKKADHLLRNIVIVLILSLGALFFISSAKSDGVDKLPVVTQKLVKPPLLPEHDQVARGGPKVVKVKMTIDEKLINIDDEGTQFRVFAFNDSVPGPIIVVL